MFTKALAADHDGPDFVAVSLRPGIIDTGMQTFIRSQDPARLPAVTMFEDFHRSGQLVPPAVTARKIVEKVVLAELEHGKTYRYQDL